MNRKLAEKVASAILHEGYMLYPYRPSAIKNRQRWAFGILYPPAYSEVGSGTERSVMHSECLLRTKADAGIRIWLRFLRQADEPVEHSLEFEWDLKSPQRRFEFRAPETEQAIMGAVSASCEAVAGEVLKLTIEVANTTPLPSDALDRDAALLCSLLSAHTLLTVTGGEFISLLDPPEELQQAAKACRNAGNFPVLVGEAGERDMLLCSPILLYDYPQIAPESAGDFFDATEMDEMLTLRIMTLTEEEKNEMRLAGDHARNLLERTESTAREQLARTHGAIRSLRPVSEP